MQDPSVEAIMARITLKCTPPHGAACTNPNCPDCMGCCIWADLFESTAQLDVRRLRRTVEAARREGMDMALMECLYQVSRLAAADKQCERRANDFFAEVETVRCSLAG